MLVKWIIGIIFLICFQITLCAEQLSVLTDSSTSKIFINKQLIGTSNVINEELLPGTYLVEVYQDDILVYSEMASIEIKSNKTQKTIRVSDDV